MKDIEEQINSLLVAENEKREVEENSKVIKVNKDISQTKAKITSLEENIESLKKMLLQSDEEMSLTNEDLMSKLLQRADFVAQREELDEMLETSKKSFGSDFKDYWTLQEQYSKKLEEKYTLSKQHKFYIDILTQLKAYWLNKEGISETSSEMYEGVGPYSMQYYQIENLMKMNKDDSMRLQLDDIIFSLSKSLGLLMKRDVFNHK